MRLFVAIGLPDRIKNEIEDLAQAVFARWPDPRRICRWVKPEQFHLTLKFLGECPDAALAPLKIALELTARRHAPFGLSFSKLGSFNKGKSLKVLWLGTDEGAQAVTALAGDLNLACEGAGFPRQEAPYHPHLTLARSKEPFPASTLDKVLPRIRQRSIGPVPATRISLIQSVLSPQGAHYTTLCHISLGPPAPL